MTPSLHTITCLEILKSITHSKVAGVPESLIFLSAAMGSLHPGVRDAWLRWARGPRGYEDNAVEVDDETGALFSPQHGSPGKLLGVGFDADADNDGDGGLVNQSLLAEWRREKGAPLTDDDPRVKAAITGTPRHIRSKSLQLLEGILNCGHSLKK
jgi:hypothetical protein